MKQPFRHIALHRLPGILFVAGLLCSCQQTDPQMDLLPDPPEQTRSCADSLLCWDGGAIPDTVELNKVSFDEYFTIPSLHPATLANAVYKWEIYENGVWTPFDGGESLRQSTLTKHTAKFRRKASNPCFAACSNECTVINYAFQEDPRQGTGINSNPINLGTYDSDFTVTQAVDTRAEHFRDIDRLRFCGNDVFLELEVTRRMYVELITGTMPMAVWLDVQDLSNGRGYLYSGISSGTLADVWPGAEKIFFPTPDDAELYPEWIKILDLLPGKYGIQLQGRKAYNIECVNHIISICLRGTAEPETEPMSTNQQQPKTPLL